MKRHPSLQDLSRDHHHGLVRARRLKQAAAGSETERRIAVDRLHEEWEDEILSHFADEERVLPPLIPDPDAARRLLDEHGILRRLAGALFEEQAHGRVSPDRMRLLAEHLEGHIRWEERELFPLIERCSAILLAGLETDATGTAEPARARPRGSA